MMSRVYRFLKVTVTVEQRHLYRNRISHSGEIDDKV